jgi:hypothetical protein
MDNDALEPFLLLLAADTTGTAAAMQCSAAVMRYATTIAKRQPVLLAHPSHSVVLRRRSNCRGTWMSWYIEGQL